MILTNVVYRFVTVISLKSSRYFFFCSYIKDQNGPFRPISILNAISQGTHSWNPETIHTSQVHTDNCLWIKFYMMTSSNGDIFRVTGPLCGNSPVPGEFPAQRPVTRSCDVFVDLRLNKRLSKQSWGWWFETLSGPLWRHSNEQSEPFIESNMAVNPWWFFIAKSC